MKKGPGNDYGPIESLPAPVVYIVVLSDRQDGGGLSRTIGESLPSEPRDIEAHYETWRDDVRAALDPRRPSLGLYRTDARGAYEARPCRDPPRLLRLGDRRLYRMSRECLEMRHLEGVGVLPDTPGPTESWLETYIRPDDRPHVTRAIRDAVRARSTFELEHRIWRAYGSWGRNVSRAIPVLDQHGSHDRVVRDGARRHHRDGDRGSPERE